MANELVAFVATLTDEQIGQFRKLGEIKDGDVDLICDSVLAARQQTPKRRKRQTKEKIGKG